MKTQILLSLLLITILATAAKFPAPQGYLNDFANVLDPAAEAKISSVLSQIEVKQSVEIAVVTLQSLQGEAIEQAAVDLFREWGIGKKNDNGLLLLIAVEDRAYRFEVGYGLEGILNDAKVGRIGRDYLVPYLKEDNYGEGVLQAVNAIQNSLAGNEEAQYAEKESPLEVLPLMFGVLYFIMFFVLYGAFEKKKKTKAQNAIGITHLFITFFSFFVSGTFFVLMLFLTFILLAIGFQGRRAGSGFGGYYGGFGGGSGGFGGFGGGMSGGGGAGGRF